MCVHQFVPPIPLWVKSFRKASMRTGARPQDTGGMESLLLSTFVTKYSCGPESSASLFSHLLKKVSISMAFSNSPKDPGVPASLAGGTITPAQMAGLSRAGGDSGRGPGGRQSEVCLLPVEHTSVSTSWDSCLWPSSLTPRQSHDSQLALPPGVTVEAALQFSKGSGWVQVRLGEPGLRGPCGVGSAQESAYWLSPLFIPVLATEIVIFIAISPDYFRNLRQVDLNKTVKQQSLAFISFYHPFCFLGHGVLLASAPDLGRGVAPLSCSCAVTAWHSRLLPLTSDMG